MRDFRKLEIWKLGIEIADNIYSITDKFPKSEIYGLTSQLNRAGVSIPSNIAEGASRTSEKDFKRFLEISLGSCYEVETQLIIAKKRKYLTGKIFIVIINKIQTEERKITSLINKIRANSL